SAPASATVVTSNEALMTSSANGLAQRLCQSILDNLFRNRLFAGVHANEVSSRGVISASQLGPRRANHVSARFRCQTRPSIGHLKNNSCPSRIGKMWEQRKSCQRWNNGLPTARKEYGIENIREGPCQTLTTFSQR